VASKRADPTKDPEFQRVLGNLLSMPPKPHSQMKLGKRKRKTGAKPGTRKRKSQAKKPPLGRRMLLED
jgi:hypothetical protein